MPSKMCHIKPIFTLKNNKDWPKWNLEIHQTLRKHKFTHLLKNKNQPVSKHEQQIWDREQKTACAIVISRLSPSIARAMHGLKTLETLLQAIDNYTRPTGEEALEILCDLWARLSSLSALQHSSINDYCTEAVDIQSQYQRLGCGITDAALSCAFLSGLPFEWQSWKYQQMQQRAVLVPWGESGSSTFTFSNLVQDALEEEGRLYKTALRTEEIRWGMKIKDIQANYATVVIDFCTICHGAFHKASGCSKLSLHPSLQTKRSSRKGNNLKRRRADSRGGYTGGASASANTRLGFANDVFLFDS